jgi:hypothetical protein
MWGIAVDRGEISALMELLRTRGPATVLLGLKRPSANALERDAELPAPLILRDTRRSHLCGRFCRLRPYGTRHPRASLALSWTASKPARAMLSAQRRHLHTQIDLGYGSESTRAREREVSDERRQLHRRIDELTNSSPPERWFSLPAVSRCASGRASATSRSAEGLRLVDQSLGRGHAPTIAWQPPIPEQDPNLVSGLVGDLHVEAHARRRGHTEEC